MMKMVFGYRQLKQPVVSQKSLFINPFAQRCGADKIVQFLRHYVTVRADTSGGQREYESITDNSNGLVQAFLSL